MSSSLSRTEREQRQHSYEQSIRTAARRPAGLYLFEGHVGRELSLLPSLALNFAVMYSSPGNLALFLLADALGQPDRLRGAADQDQGPEGSHTKPLSTTHYMTHIVFIYIS